MYITVYTIIYNGFYNYTSVILFAILNQVSIHPIFQGEILRLDCTSRVITTFRKNMHNFSLSN